MLKVLQPTAHHTTLDIKHGVLASPVSSSGTPCASSSGIRALAIIASLVVSSAAVAIDSPVKAAADSITSSDLVTVDAFNYVRAKTAIQFDKYLSRADGKINTFYHRRAVVDIDAKSSKRLNRDTLYSAAIVDISQGATVVVPDVGDRYVSVQVVNEEGFTNKVFHGGGSHSLTVKEFDTPYVWLLVRTLVFDSIAGDVAAANSLQDQMKINSASAKTYTHPAYDPVSFVDTTKPLLELGKGIKDNSKAAGTKQQVDPIKQLLLSAYGFGTLPETESFLMTVEPNLPSNKAYTLTVKDVPVDGFWSLAMYNKDGYFEENQYNSYGFGDRTAKKNPDGSITLHFGGSSDSVNYIPLTEGWNYVVRLYRPRAEVLDGSWQFPEVKLIVK
ncbi:MAG: hypothetical protein ACI9XU_000208 [Arenicella sp.]|jgi:hypothetical protein